MRGSRDYYSGGYSSSNGMISSGYNNGYALGDDRGYALGDRSYSSTMRKDDRRAERHVRKHHHGSSYSGKGDKFEKMLGATRRHVDFANRIP